MARILHVTESMASGVMVSLAGLARCQSRDGHQVVVLHTRRPESPDIETLTELFPEPIRRIEIPRDGRSAVGFMALTGHICRSILRHRPDAIHLHSSYAGLAGRLAAVAMGILHRTVYSPHGFAFLNKDSERFNRIVVFAEKSLNRLGGKLALVSQSELNQAQESLGARRSYVLQNRLTMSSLPVRRQKRQGKPVIGTVGRISYAKGPWQFAEIARLMSDKASFVWIGDGAAADKSRWLRDSTIDVTGWQSPTSATTLASELDIYVSTALWEGMPLAVMEAQALGVPCVVSDIGGNIDAIEDDVTGFVCSDLDEFVSALERLIENDELRSSMGRAAAKRAEREFSDSSLSEDSMKIYFA